MDTQDAGGRDFFDGVSVAVWIEGSGTRATGRPIDLDCAADALLQDAAAERGLGADVPRHRDHPHGGGAEAARVPLHGGAHARWCWTAA